MKLQKGFTLIELLVVIAIIGLLSSVILASLASARGKAYDARRLTDMHQIIIGLELYKSSYDLYPAPDPAVATFCSGWETSGNDQQFVKALKSIGFIVHNYKDPVPGLDGPCGNYRYYLYPAGTGGCPVSRGNYYILGVVSTDKSGLTKYPSSPGFACSGVDYQNQFSWVTGGFDN